MLMMKKVKIVVGLIIGLILTSMTVYDLRPYRERNYFTHNGSTTRSFDMDFNSTTYWIDLEIDPFIDIQDPFPNTNSTYLLSSSINVSVLLISNTDQLRIYSSLPIFFTLENNTPTIFNDVRFGDNRHFCDFLRFTNTTDVSCFFTYTANYTLDMIYMRPPKTYVWVSLFAFLTTEGIILIGVVLFASILIYLSTKMVTDS